MKIFDSLGYTTYYYFAQNPETKKLIGAKSFPMIETETFYFVDSTLTIKKAVRVENVSKKLYYKIDSVSSNEGNKLGEWIYGYSLKIDTIRK